VAVFVERRLLFARFRFTAHVAVQHALQQSKKAGGATLGNPTNISQAGQVGRRAQRIEADRHATNVLPVIRSILSHGPVGMVAIRRN
jgi:hypothetical protein